MAVTATVILPAQPKVPVWVRDEQWNVWHAWPTDHRMDRDGWSLTACMTNWWWSATTLTSYHVLTVAACADCNLALQGALPKRRGRRGSLPQGPLELPVEHVPEDKSRTERLLELGAKKITYQRGDKTVTSAHPDRGMREVMAAEAAADVAWAGTFEVGTRLPAWECMRCGQVLAYGDRFCGTWCVREQRRQEAEDKWERQGLPMARRQFEDILYRRPRRDTIRSWTPPQSQYRTPNQRARVV
jgi:hypothetical protein